MGAFLVCGQQMARDDADLCVRGGRKLFDGEEQYLSCFNLTFI